MSSAHYFQCATSLLCVQILVAYAFTCLCTGSILAVCEDGGHAIHAMAYPLPVQVAVQTNST